MRTPFRNLLCGMTASGAFVLAQNPISVNVSEVPNGPAWKKVSIKVTNQSASPVTAIAVRSLCALKSGEGRPNRPGRRDDPFVRIRPGIDAAIAPGATMEYQIGGAPPPFGDWACTGAVEAALFLDGTAIGDATMVDRLRRTRVLTAREIAWHIAALSRFQGAENRGDTVLNALEDHRSSTESTARNSDETVAIESVSDVVTHNLFDTEPVDCRVPIDASRLDRLLSALEQWQKRLASQIPETASP